MPSESTIKLDIESIRPYYEAFKESNTENGLTQKDLASQCGIKRHGDFSDVFRYLEDSAIKEPTHGQVRKIKKSLTNHWKIEDGLLIPINPLPISDIPSGVVTPVTVYRNYNEAKIGSAVAEAGDKICIINTYLTSRLFHLETIEEDNETLKNWLFKQDKKVQVLMLRPDGKGMWLRTKSKLDLNGSKLANTLLWQLEDLLDMQRRLPSGHLEIKLMDEIPGMAAFILDNKIFYGLHYSFGHTESGPWFGINDPSHFSYPKIRQHFEELWNDDTRSFSLTEENLKHFRRALNVVRRELGFLENSKWKIHLHDLSNIILGKGPAPFGASTGDIITWDLEISKPERGIYFMARITIPGFDKPIVAKLVTEKISDRDYAHIRFSDFNQHSIHLSFHCRQDTADEPILGYFVISAGSDICSGYAVLLRTEKINNTTKEIPIYLRRLLTFRDSSYLSLARTRSEMAKFRAFPFKGTYKVYSYGGKKGGDKNIKVNWLQINEYGVARYKNQHFPALIGRATHIGQNLHIVFTHFKDKETQRRSYLIVSVHDSEPEKGRYYSAVHLGVSWEKQMPTGKRFILEYDEEYDFEQVTWQTIPLHSPEYQKLLPGIRNLLSGRVKNLLGFLRKEGHVFDYEDIKKEWKESIHLSEVFYDSALQNARRGYTQNDKKYYEKAAEMILRAVNHGFDDMPRFEEEVAEFDATGLEVIRKYPDYQIIFEKIFKTTSEWGL